MRILFGPEHDGPHIDPDTPGAYEWWYFDALSDDGRHALVAIWFHGSPMSPYYKAVVDGKNPLPRDWCGVFFSLHEKVNGRWRERAYAYNLYRLQDRPGEIKEQWFRDAPLGIKLGGSELEGRYTDRGRFIGYTWDLRLDEPGLWHGRTRAELEFQTPGKPLKLPPMGEAEDGAEHSWVCVAPICQVSGTVTLPNGSHIEFKGNGYHDHNFGRLPWRGMDTWYWFHAPLRSGYLLDEPLVAVVYHMEPTYGTAPPQTVFLVLKEEKDSETEILTDIVEIEPSLLVTNRFGLQHRSGLALWALDKPLEDFLYCLAVGWESKPGALSDGPFYRRMAVGVDFSVRFPKDRDATFLTRGPGIDLCNAQGEGIGEVFQPARLCGPIASRAMWTRIRRRS